ncbi:hypothetical protein W911_09550 [Hyphomicrobium nitrativorans NL23]|uniref:Uncharacterized protein n=1 Tax=Hyphomicrobium nitrativorans NL23 TaxID=1029756 RepID=V5SJ92_9HYPH|nr:hypothetical protein [Hyphomicrobium nitrativorans]AHB50160.1 hypothetical protein W911_09550 [Hyphomicrobium nitrativorans NL23]
MTRYNNPLPHAQAPPAQGRPAGAAHPHQPHLGQPHPGHGQPQAHAEPELSGWPQPAAGFRQPPVQPAPHQHRPAQQGYPDLGYAEQDAGAAQDPFAALRPDGYGMSPQPSQAHAADPYGLQGYSAPQPATQGYAPPRQAPASQAPSAHQAPSHLAAYDPFAPPGESYAPQGQPGGYSPPFANATPPQTNGGYGGLQGQGYAQPSSAPPSSSPAYAGYAAPAQPGGPFGRAEAHHQPQAYADQWGAAEHDDGHAHGGHSLALDANDYQGPGAYGDAGAHGEHAHWGTEAYADPQGELAQGHYQGQHGTFDQSYADDDAMYEDEPRGRGAGWKKAATLVACTVLLGGGLVYGVSGLFGPGGGEPTPLVRGAEGPSKVKPSEPGGKRFDHADSKIMGRLGEGAATADPSGVRKVPVVSVGRDGQIQPPSSERETQAIVAVPGLR